MAAGNARIRIFDADLLESDFDILFFSLFFFYYFGCKLVSVTKISTLKAAARTTDCRIIAAQFFVCVVVWVRFKFLVVSIVYNLINNFWHCKDKRNCHLKDPKKGAGKTRRGYCQKCFPIFFLFF
jgi:hypothetical protein